MCVCDGLVTKSCPTLEILWTVGHQASLSMAFYRQEYWSWLTFPSPGDLPHPRIKPGSPTLQMISCIVGRFFLLTEPPGKPSIYVCVLVYIHVCVCIYTHAVWLAGSQVPNQRLNLDHGSESLEP